MYFSVHSTKYYTLLCIGDKKNYLAKIKVFPIVKYKTVCLCIDENKNEYKTLSL